MPYRTLQRGPCSAGGFTLVELMISLTIGMLIMAGVTLLFTNSSQARNELEKANRQIENGRYAAQLLTEDLRLAGYYGEFEPVKMEGPAVTPDPCTVTGTALTDAMPLVVQGYDDSANLGCISDRRSNTDVVVVRHASPCMVGDAECGAMSTGVTYFQASLCSSSGLPELSSSTVLGNHFAISTVAGNLNLHKRDCAAKADLRRYQTHIYFIANNDKGSDGIPTLKRAELASGGWSTPVPLVEGVENLQIEYGVDLTCDGAPDVYTPAPEGLTPAYPGSCTPPVNIWTNVVSVKFNILARNTETTTGHTDQKTYVLGFKADGTANSVGPFNDNIKRHVYESVVRLDNPAGRKG